MGDEMERTIGQEWAMGDRMVRLRSQLWDVGTTTQ